VYLTPADQVSDETFDKIAANNEAGEKAGCWEAS
jgi:hypothetical protein